MIEKEIPELDFNDEIESTIPFYIEKVGELRDVSQLNLSTPHRHNFHVLAFVKYGRGIHTVDFQKFKYKAENSVLIIRANQVHLADIVVSFDATVLTFTKEFIYPSEHVILDDNMNINFIKLTKEEFEYLYKFIDEITIEYKSDKKWKTNIIQNYLNIILTHLGRIYLQKQPRTQSKQADPLLLKFKKLINENYLDLRFVSDYAKLLYITSGHLNDRIKEITGKTAKELINERLLLEAKRFLFFKDYNIKEIATNLKFKDIAYFNRFFKIQTGMTPLDFRNKILKKYK